MSRSAMDTLTPMLRQYRSIKAQHPDAILLFRLGDFYEMFYDDALVASKALSLTLTSRGRGTRNEAPMCGVPLRGARGPRSGDSRGAQIALFRPREPLHPEGQPLESLLPQETLDGVLTRAVPGWMTGADSAARLLNEILGTATLAGFGVEG